VLLTTPLAAQEFPSQPVKLVVPYPPGGGVDGLARPIAERLSQTWGKPVIVENRPGASTIIGTESVVKAAPDGHTLLFTTDSTVTSNPHLFKTLSYDPLKDLVPVTQLIDLHQMVVVHPSVSASSIKELVALAKAKPGTLNYASYGNGSQPHLLYEMLKKETGVNIVQVPFKGIAPALTAVIAGETQMTLGGAATSAGHMKAGRLKALAISRPARLPSHPEVPTLVEAGFPGIDPRSWFGLFAPARTPSAIVERIQKATAAVIGAPDFKEKYIDAPGYTGVGQSPAEFAKFVADDMAYKKRLISVTGITAE
jgi:tripartite-type tricarboxylate transporter receptor subunit TctC